MKKIRNRTVLSIVLAVVLGSAAAQPLEAIWCEILNLPEMACVFCHRWINLGAETCDLWQGWCSDGWYDNGWYCWGQI